MNKTQIWQRLTEAEQELAILRRHFGTEVDEVLKQKMEPDFGEEC
jgi:hypothetical protein